MVKYSCFFVFMRSGIKGLEKDQFCTLVKQLKKETTPSLVEMYSHVFHTWLVSPERTMDFVQPKNITYGLRWGGGGISQAQKCKKYNMFSGDAH
jgi:hypothetical protein